MINMESKLSKVASGRIFIAFASLIVILIALGLISIFSINSLTKDLKHMYRTGVVPEHDGARLLELQYENRYRLEEYISGLSHDLLPQIKSELDKNSQIMDSLGSYHLSADYFEPEKKVILKEFLRHHAAYKKIESQVVNLGVNHDYESAKKVFLGEGYTEFRKSIKALDLLEDSELNQGGLQLQETVAYANNLRVIEFVTIIAAIVIAVIIGTAVGRNLIEN